VSVDLKAYPVSASTTISNGFEFGNSAESVKDYSYLTKDFTHKSASNAYLNMYTLAWNEDAQLKFTSRFISSLQAISSSSTSNQEIYSKFVSSYGTHYFKSIVAGARAVVISYGKSSMSDASFQEYTNTVNNIGLTVLNFEAGANKDETIAHNEVLRKYSGVATYDYVGIGCHQKACGATQTCSREVPAVT